MKRLFIFMILIFFIVGYHPRIKAADKKVRELTFATAPGDSTLLLLSWKSSGNWYSRAMTLEKFIDIMADSLNSTGLEQSSGRIRIAAAAAGDGLTGGAGTALAVNPDNSTLELNNDQVRIKNNGINGSKINDTTLTVTNSNPFGTDSTYLDISALGYSSPEITGTINKGGWIAEYVMIRNDSLVFANAIAGSGTINLLVTIREQ
jgi:hypothetical protein